MSADPVLDYWFGDTTDWLEVATRNKPRWFERGFELDDEIRARFGATVGEARAGALDHWASQPRSLLALLLCLDQFPRHIFRGKAAAFDSDDRALALCRRGIEQGLDGALSVVERSFFYLPLEHAEELAAQELSVVKFRSAAEDAPQALAEFARVSLSYAEQHHEIVARFGRFPHRNAILDRTPTAEETAFLASGGARFGQ